MRSNIFGQMVLFVVISGGPAWAASQDLAINDTGMTVTLKLTDAVDQAVHNNVLMKLAHERIAEAQGRRWQGSSDMLPHISLEGSQRRVYWDNLSEAGFTEFGVIGPYNSFDARVQVVQRVFDLSAFSKIRAGNLDVRIARLKDQLARQEVMMAAVLAYLDVLRGEERLHAVKEDIRLAEEFQKLAEHQLTAGIVTKLDVIRAKTRLAQQKARQQEVIQGLDTARFRLARVADLPLASKISLADSLNYFDETFLSLPQAIETAVKGRLEMSIADTSVDLKTAQRSEAGNERFPRLELAGNYGRAGAEVDKMPHDVAVIGVRVSMPVFEGGKIEGKIAETESQKKQEEMLRDDLKVQIEEDIRLAVQTLMTSREQVAAARETLDMAKEEVTLAQNQYTAGVGNNISVIDAQTALERAQETYVSALVQYHTARVNYYSSLGKMEAFHLNTL